MQFHILMIKQESKYSRSVVIIINQGEAAYGREEREEDLCQRVELSQRAGERECVAS